MILKELDKEYFEKHKPTNPNDYIDMQTQKVMITPGVPYKSTS